MRWRHTHGWVDRWWRRRTVGGTSRTRVVLATSPAETNARVSDGVALHLVDGHLSCMTLNELHEATTLSRWDLDVGDFTKALEERPKLVLGDIAGETTNEDGGVVRIGELVHGLRSAIVSNGRLAHVVDVSAHTLLRPLTRHTTHASRPSPTGLVLRCGGRDPHRTVAAVDTLHLLQSALLVTLVGEADESVSTGHATDWVCHDLGGLARWKAVLEERDQDVFVDLRTEVADKY